jgi:branched-chain amino acid transport system substrate-binding protein
MYNLTPLPKKFAIWILLTSLAFTTVVVFAFVNPFREKIEIAMVSSLSNSASLDQNNVDAVNLYLKSVNKAGGINGKQVVLSVYDDQNKLDVALQVAETIVRSKAVAVIGHRTSDLTLAGSKAYEEYTMPVISGGVAGDKLSEFKWFFRTIFSNKVQSTLMANYVNKIMKYSKVTVIEGDDVYGKNLGEQVVSKFKELGGEVVNKLIVGEDFSKDIEQIIKALQTSIKAGEDPGLLIGAMPFNRAVEFIKQVKLANLNLPILGGNSFADTAITEYFAKDPREQKEKGFFTNGIRAFTPAIFDVLDDTGQQFRSDFEQAYGREPGTITAAFYDAAVGIVEALKQSDINGKTTKELRSLVITGLKEFNTQAKAFRGAGRFIYFDKNGDTIVPAYVGLYDRTQLTSAFTQLQIIVDPSIVEDLPNKVQSGEILKIGDLYLQKTNIVYVGMDINDLDNIDEAKSTYLVDFYLWFRYRGNVPADEIEFTNYSTEHLDSGVKLSLAKPIKEGKEEAKGGDINYKIYRMKADFSDNFEFHLYPFDRQTLKVKFRHANLTRDQLIYVIDTVGMRGAKSEKILAQAKRIGVFDNISSWIIEKVQFFQNTLIDNSTFGNRQLIDADSDIRYSQFNASIHIKRDVLSFSIRNLLPLLFFIIVAYFLMFLPIEHVSVEAVSGLLLAVVFYHLNLTDRLPKTVGYTVLLDYAFYIVYALLGLQLLIIVLTHSKRIKSYGIDASHLISWGRIAFPSIIGVSTIYLGWIVFQSSI